MNKIFTSEQMATASLVMAAMNYENVCCNSVSAEMAALSQISGYSDYKAREMYDSTEVLKGKGGNGCGSK